MIKNRDKSSLPPNSRIKEGAELALVNARRHLRVAKLLGDERLFGPGSTHVILAVEELVKSLVFSSIAAGVEIPKSFKREVMKFHGPRHSFAFGLLFSRTVRTLALKVMARAFRSGSSMEKALEKEIKLARSHSVRTASYGAELDWIADANEIKDRGLYVDFDGKDWRHPGSISKKHFVFGYRIAEQLIREKGRAVRKQLKTEFRADDTSKALMREIATKRPSEDREEQWRYLVELALK